MRPRISGDRVIFTDLGGSSADIFVGDVNTGGFVNITDTPDRDEKLNDIDGNLAVYTDITGIGGGRHCCDGCYSTYNTVNSSPYRKPFY